MAEDRISDFLGILLKNRMYERVHENLELRLKLFWHFLRTKPTSILTAKRCIRHHYDLGNDFFKLFLDKSMTYSCGYQLSGADTLDDMQKQKYERICRKLAPKPGSLMIDIGCGWGGMLIYAAKKYGVSGLGITLSEEQCKYARELVKLEGLAGRIRIDLCDYRQVQGKFDHVVSIGMFEHVGRACYPLFMQKIKALLNPGGTGLLHTIGLTDAPGVKPDPWINRYIFPGSRLPRLQEIVAAMHKEDLLIAHVEDWKLHYAETLRKWKENFDSNRAAISALGPRYDRRFLRMWNYYLQTCEASFRSSTVQLYQVLFSRGEQWSFPRCFRF